MLSRIPRKICKKSKILEYSGWEIYSNFDTFNQDRTIVIKGGRHISVVLFKWFKIKENLSLFNVLLSEIFCNFEGWNLARNYTKVI